MARSRIPLGTWGSIRCYGLDDGRFKARGKFRELWGGYSDLSAIGSTAEEAVQRLRERASTRSIDGWRVGCDSTLLHTSMWWLRAKELSGRLAVKTLMNYQRDVGDVNRAFGDFRLQELSVAIVDAVIGRLSETEPKRAIRVRKTLKQMLDDAVRVGAIPSNPVDAVRPPRVPKEEPYTLSPEQAQFVREAYRAWRDGRKKPGPAPDPRVAAMLDVLLTVGLRIGELLALRHCDVDLDAERPRLVVAATLVDGLKGEPIWQDHTKARRQRRVLLLSEVTVATLQPYVDASMGTAPVFPNQHGSWLRPGNVRRILHSFRDESSDELARLGVENSRLTPQLFRRTLATLLASEAGIDRAKEQLGHASVTTTERHYVTPPPIVGHLTVDLIDSFFGEIPEADDHGDGTREPAE